MGLLEGKEYEEGRPELASLVRASHKLLRRKERLPQKWAVSEITVPVKLEPSAHTSPCREKCLSS
jgi:hypothetical protein